jgi:putative MATE family efflux protein
MVELARLHFTCIIYLGGNILPNEKKRLHQLFFPIFLELLCMMLTGAADTFMLSSVGDQAVGAVGTANTYISIFIIMFSVISSGMVAVMTQFIGAGRPGVAKQALKLGLFFNVCVGLVLTALLTLGAETILLTVGIAPGLLAYAKAYLQIVGLFCLCNAMTPIFSSYLRAFGHTSPTLAATIAANAVNLVLNAVFLYVFSWGVWGVALATGLSRLTHLLWVVIASKRRIHAEKDPNPPSNRTLLARIIQVGLPAAMETALYNLSITLVIRFLNQMDDTGFQAIARSYAMQITNFSFSAGAALAHANAILVGWRIGAEEYELCDRGTRKAGLLAILLGAGTATIFAIFSHPLISLFTNDENMIRLVGYLLIIDIALEVGRASNLVFGIGLKTAGDAVYPMVVAVVFAFICAAGGTWFFGIHLGWLAVGAYAAMALDECTRAVFMFLRWHSGKWKTKRLIQQAKT